MNFATIDALKSKLYSIKVDCSTKNWRAEKSANDKLN